MCVLTDEPSLLTVKPLANICILTTPPLLLFLFLSRYFPTSNKIASRVLLLMHASPAFVPILFLKDQLNHIILSYQSLSNLSYSCCTSALAKNSAKKSCSPLIFCTSLLTYPWPNANTAQVSTFTLAKSCFSYGNLFPETSK